MSFMYFSRATVGARGWGSDYEAVFLPMNPYAIQA